MDIQENSLRYKVSVQSNSEQATISAQIRSSGKIGKTETKDLVSAGIQTDKQAKATVAEKIVIDGGGGEHEYYSGAYHATPMVTTQVFPTEEKIMAHDFTVFTIPTTETLNSAGGYTFKIG